MKLKKYVLIGIMALLVIVGCDNKGNEKNDKDNVKVTDVKRDISTEEIIKYNEYLKLSDVPNSEEWNAFFTEIKKEEFTDQAGNIKNISELATFTENLDNSINLTGEYIKEITDVMQKAPKMEAIDKNAENLLNSLIEEQKVLTEINDYFEKGDYKTDKLSKIEELNDKYKVVLKNRQENHKIFTNSLNEIAQIINQKIEKQLQTDGKTAKLNILKFVNSVDNFGKIAFGKNNLNFDENEVKILEEANKNVQNTYKAVSEMTLENAKKENINEEDFKKIKESSKLLSENMQKMVAGVKNQNIQDVVMSASNILSAKTDLENVFNVLVLKK
ncbi:MULTISPECIES: DUF3829 domain-containing protein [unclassified Leptotrichia]|jgi:hypothetical protein|uniref:DUF3829 domain-containing protein n=1 Tax=unclassified Leptotrichia TaxID=2633022 RepID=UPI0003ADD77F|nr:MULTISPECIES: DUF3829 domain-containing protein [unclassified Leptotrichia]ERL26540.1 hypothetical protein HMPREF9108_00887 [Leptotrichia sp. oral taxon 225 str. F0581]WLD73310.1 DUF3829 domain-containing protein [Leptotrichia sp. HMT-225]